jgi:hypothetical protein
MPYRIDFLRQLVPVVVLYVLSNKEQAIIGTSLLGQFDERLLPSTNSWQLETGHLLESCIYD